MNSKRLVSAIVLLGVILAPAGAHADSGVGAPRARAAVPMGCSPVERVSVSQYGLTTYEAVGPAVGKYNASSVASSLTYNLNMSVSKSSSISAGAKLTYEAAVVKVEGNLGFTVTDQTTTGVSVTDQLLVPAKRYGYEAAKVEYRVFRFTEQVRNLDCSWSVVANLGDLRAITASPFFSSCISTGPCTPKP